MSQATSHNETCPSDRHKEEHLCFLMYGGFHLAHPDKYRDMVQDARFRCEHCSRTAAKAESLCKPVAI